MDLPAPPSFVLAKCRHRSTLVLWLRRCYRVAPLRRRRDRDRQGGALRRLLSPTFRAGAMCSLSLGAAAPRRARRNHRRGPAGAAVVRFSKMPPSVDAGALASTLLPGGAASPSPRSRSAGGGLCVVFSLRHFGPARCVLYPLVQRRRGARGGITGVDLPAPPSFVLAKCRHRSTLVLWLRRCYRVAPLRRRRDRDRQGGALRRLLSPTFRAGAMCSLSLGAAAPRRARRNHRRGPAGAAVVRFSKMPPSVDAGALASTLLPGGAASPSPRSRSAGGGSASSSLSDISGRRDVFFIPWCSGAEARAAESRETRATADQSPLRKLSLQKSSASKGRLRVSKWIVQQLSHYSIPNS